MNISNKIACFYCKKEFDKEAEEGIAYYMPRPFDGVVEVCCCNYCDAEILPRKLEE